MRKGRGGGGFKAGDACGDVFNEIVTRAEAFWGGRLDGPSGKTGVDVESTMSSMSCIISHFVEAVKIPNLVEGPNLALHLAPNREIHGEITYSMWMRLDKKKKKTEKEGKKKLGC